MFNNPFTGNPEVLDEYARQRENALRRECYARHPERAFKQRLRCAVYLLSRSGYLDEQTSGALISAIGGAVR